MSRVGRMPVTVPSGVVVNIENDEVTVKGPKGELYRRFNPDMSITLHENSLTVSRPTDSKVHRSQHGLTRSLLANMVEGVTQGYQKKLEVYGTGYGVKQQGQELSLSVGFAAPVMLFTSPAWNPMV